jgi:4-hydroxy-tetrahydrodipicolinate synthase
MKLKGNLFTAMITPFNDDYSLNLNMAKKLAKKLINEGSDGIVVCGTTGESPTLSRKEKCKMFETIVEAVGDVATVVAGTGTYSTKESVELSKVAQEIGVDGVMIVGPYYNKPPQEGLYQHFKTIAGSIDIPVLIYNVPSRTSRNIDASTIIRLSEMENIVAVKEASGDFKQITKIIMGKPPTFKVLSGNDGDTFGVLNLGGDGIVSVASHLVGRDIKEMIESHKKGDIKKALEIHLRLSDIFETLFITTNPIPVKTMVNMIGINVGPLRLPLISATESEKKRFEESLKKLNLL